MTHILLFLLHYHCARKGEFSCYFHSRLQNSFENIFLMASEIKCLSKKEGYFPKAHLAKVPILLFSNLYCIIIPASNKLKEVFLSIFRQGCS